MNTEDYDVKVNRATAYLEEFPADVVVFLAENFTIAKLEAAIKTSCTRHKKHFGTILSRDRSGSYSNQSVQPAISPQLSYVAPHSQMLPPQQQPPVALPTPPNSQASESGNSTDLILALDSLNQEKGLYVSRVDVQYNWIRADVAYSRLCLPKRLCGPPGYVSCVYNGITLHATEHVQITWREPHWKHSKHGDFLVVHGHFMADVLFGDQTYNPIQPSMNYSPAPHPLSPLPHRPGVHPVNAPSTTWYQAGSQASEATIRQMNQHTPVQVAGMSTHFQDINNWQQQTYSAAATPVPPASQPASVPAHVPGATPAQPTSSSGQTAKMKVQYGGSTFPVDIDLSGSGDALCTKLQSTFSKLALDRSSFQILISTRMNSNAAEAMVIPVRLNNEDLEDDWQDAVEWIREKGSGRLYASIEPIQTG